MQLISSCIHFRKLGEFVNLINHVVMYQGMSRMNVCVWVYAYYEIFALDKYFMKQTTFFFCFMYVDVVAGLLT
jgi:hypothetical protein